MIEAIKRRLFCPLGLHVGHVRVGDGLMWFHCTRCGADIDERPHDPLQFRPNGSQDFGEWLDE